MNMKQEKKIAIVIVVGTAIALLLGCMIDFLPFLGDDLIVREIQYCTFLICVVISVCTYIILSHKR